MKSNILYLKKKTKTAAARLYFFMTADSCFMSITEKEVAKNWFSGSQAKFPTDRRGI